ncbi:hypothetical protein [Nonomuraea sp. JJY05]|uniref:hypothetical protein n=1 Tax=Nonomuraea sp. JJY05 TaxID=3350255 RepID=UPI00373EA75D
MVSIRANALAGIAAAIAVMLAPATAHAGTGGSITSPANGNTIKAGTSLTVGADVTNVCDAKITITTPGGDTQPVASAPYDPLCAPTSFSGKYTPATAGSYTLTLAAGKGAVIDTVTITATTPPTTATPTATPTATETPEATPQPTVTVTVTPTPTPTVTVTATPKATASKKATATAKATTKPKTASTPASPAVVYVNPPAPAPQAQPATTVEVPEIRPTMQEIPAPVAPAPAQVNTPPAANAVGMATVGSESAISAVGGFLTGTALPIAATAVLVYGLMLIRSQRKTAAANPAPEAERDGIPADADAPTTVHAPYKG